MQLESGLDWDHGTPCLDSSNVLACYQSKSYNVHTMCLLVTKVSIRSLQCACQIRGHLNTCHQLSPYLSPNIPMLANKVSLKKRSRYILVLICILSNCNWGNQAQLKQPWSFFSGIHYIYYTSTAKLASCKSSLLTNYDCRPFCLWGLPFLLPCALWRCSL